MARRLLELERVTPLGTLRLAEPTRPALRRALPTLARFYNDPHNARLLGNTIVFTPRDVHQFWTDGKEAGGALFLLWRDGVLVGDSDFRNVTKDTAEVAILIGPRGAQGLGLGAHFLAMLLTLGFAELDLRTVYAAIKPENHASIRLFERAGFSRDEGLAARSYAEEEEDVCLSLRREVFLGGEGARG